MSVRLVLVRHGESLWNTEKRYQGQADSGLTERGLAQAEVAAAIVEAGFGTADLVLTSDLPRARDTAAAYESRFGGVPVRVDARLREIDVGDWTGRTFAEVAAAHPERLAEFERGVDVRRGGGETFAELRERVWAALTEAAAEVGAGTVVAFAHGGSIRVAAAAALRVPPPGHRQFSPPVNCSLTVIDYGGPDATHALVAYNQPTAAGATGGAD
ncbi:histidine phosphatase family protein [Asanoa sp. NPDC049573]|uniref:histidine phosphatase family protein n=1 Tax=Asanoa sp. NPDC049573 TaxID=3155396 RepID=UPI003423D65F